MGLGAGAPGQEVVREGGLPGSMNVPGSERALRIAIVYSRLPLPMERADQMTVAHLIAFLARRGHAVDLWTLDNGEAITAAQREPAGTFAAEQGYVCPPRAPAWASR